MVGVDVFKREIGMRINHIIPFGPPFHSFLEFYGKSAGFSPNGGAGIVGDGIINSPDIWGGDATSGWNSDSHRVRRLWIDDCCIDLEKFQKNLTKQIEAMNGSTALTYVLILYDCSAFADTAINVAIDNSHKSDRPWLCNISKEWAWYDPSYNGN